MWYESENSRTALTPMPSPLPLKGLAAMRRRQCRGCSERLRPMELPYGIALSQENTYRSKRPEPEEFQSQHQPNTTRVGLPVLRYLKFSAEAALTRLTQVQTRNLYSAGLASADCNSWQLHSCHLKERSSKCTGLLLNVCLRPLAAS